MRIEKQFLEQCGELLVLRQKRFAPPQDLIDHLVLPRPPPESRSA